MLPADDQEEEQVLGTCAQQSYYWAWGAEGWSPCSHGTRTELWGHVTLIPPFSASFSCPVNLSLTYMCCLGCGYGWWTQEEQVRRNAPPQGGAGLQQRAGGLRCDEEVHGLSKKQLAMDSLALLAAEPCQAARPPPPANVPAKSKRLVWNKVSQLALH